MPNLDAANIAYQMIKVLARRAAGRTDSHRRGAAGAYPDAVGHRARRRQHDRGRRGRGASPRQEPIGISVSYERSCDARWPLQRIARVGCKNLLDHGGRCAYLRNAAVISPRARVRHQRHSHSVEPACRPLGLRSLVGEDGMRQNALLRSAKGLGTPSTARKEDFAIATPALSTEERNDHFVVRNGVRCAGAHLIIDLYEAERLDDIDHIEADVAPLRGGRGRDAAAHPSASLRAEWRRFRRGGAGRKPHLDPLLARGGYAALDVFMCGNAKPEACVPVLREAFKAKRIAVERTPARAGRLSLSLPMTRKGPRLDRVNGFSGPMIPDIAPRTGEPPA